MKYTRVDLKDELTVRLNEHHVLMSFDDDEGRHAFSEWWEAEGSQIFFNWVKDNPNYSHLINLIIMKN